jgi:DNA repair protein SbcC/Rad50
MVLYQKIDESYNRIKSIIRLLLESHSEMVVLNEGGCPILLLETTNDAVGFVILSGVPELEYPNVYNCFKNIYRKNHIKWKTKNLSFVIFRYEPKSIHDNFFSSIETDVYFCRKYILNLPKENSELERELLKLPFLPLPEGREGGIIRPPSAQTLLQHLNVPAKRARQIIVPRESSSSYIISQILSEGEPLPEIKSISKKENQIQVQPTEHTRINNLIIKGFRAYRNKQEFNLNADVIVLYGPNGLGKTSFFDAIDYVCTGQIGRLCRRRINQSDFIGIARHLGALDNDCYVSMQIGKDNNDYFIKRRIDDWSNALIGGENKKRSDVLQFLTSAKWGETKARIENLERLFRATHLFSQTTPELLAEFELESTLSSDIVSRMLALDDYTSGLSKVLEIIDQLNKRIEKNNENKSILLNSYNEIQSQLKALSVLQDSLQAGKQLKELAIGLVKDLQAITKTIIVDMEPTISTTREWRALVESTLEDAKDKLSKLLIIESGFYQFVEDRNACKTNEIEQDSLDKIIKKQTIEIQQQQAELKKLTETLANEQITLSKITSRQRALSELSGLQEIYKSTGSTLRQWQQELKRISHNISETTSELQPLLPIAENLQSQVNEIQPSLNSTIKNIQLLLKIQDELSTWKNKKELITNLSENISNTKSYLQLLRGEIEQLNKDIRTKEEKLFGVIQDYNNINKNQIELTKLLDEIEHYVQNSICPTCGTDHCSIEALKDRIRTQKQSRPAYVEKLAENLGQLKNIIEKNKTSLLIKSEEEASNNIELKQKIVRFNEAQNWIAKFEESINILGVDANEEIEIIIIKEIEKEKKAQCSLQNNLRKIESELENTTKHINSLKMKLSEQNEAQKRAEAETIPLQQQIGVLIKKTETLNLSLEMTTDELNNEMKNITTNKISIDKRISDLTSQFDIMSKRINDVKGLFDEKNEEIKIVRQNINRFKKNLKTYEENANTILDKCVLDMNTIIEKKRLYNELVDNLEKLKKRCLNLERAVDSAQRSANIVELETKAQDLENEKKELEKQFDQITKIKKWFTIIEDTLKEYNSNAVAKHVEAFGPLTTLLQKRLRPVYGFGDVELKAKKNEIHVMVNWGHEYVKPIDYFSDSQKQILTLSLFLAGRLTQSWSGFAPILMDDPVTHFDDLNSFGFVELIRGLINTEPGKRQFIISTCEDRLFDLMREKFNDAPGGSKFYRFEGIGPDGPNIKELNY